LALGFFKEFFAIDRAQTAARAVIRAVAVTRRLLRAEK